MGALSYLHIQSLLSVPMSPTCRRSIAVNADGLTDGSKVVWRSSCQPKASKMTSMDPGRRESSRQSLEAPGRRRHPGEAVWLHAAVVCHDALGVWEHLLLKRFDSDMPAISKVLLSQRKHRDLAFLHVSLFPYRERRLSVQVEKSTTIQNPQC